MATIQFKRGAASGIPTLAAGEPGWTTDDEQLYVGTGSGNVLIGPVEDAADLGSGAATDGYVLTADGAGGSAWEAPGASGLTHPDVMRRITLWR